MMNALTLFSLALALSFSTEHASSASTPYALGLARYKDLPCGELVSIQSLALEGGHTQDCFQEKPVSYEYCRMLLQQTPSCSALTYSMGNCWIHDRSRSNFSMAPQPRMNAAALSIVKLDRAMGECNISRTERGASSALTRFESCMMLQENRDVSKLPQLAIVISVTQRWAQENDEELSAVVSNLQCYCGIHGYSFVSICVPNTISRYAHDGSALSQHLNVMKDMNTYRFFHQRHTVVAETYLPRYERSSLTKSRVNVYFLL